MNDSPVVRLELPREMVQTVLRALGELPAKYSMTAILVIQDQVARQKEEKPPDQKAEGG